MNRPVSLQVTWQEPELTDLLCQSVQLSFLQLFNSQRASDGLGQRFKGSMHTTERFFFS